MNSYKYSKHLIPIHEVTRDVRSKLNEYVGCPVRVRSQHLAKQLLKHGVVAGYDKLKLKTEIVMFAKLFSVNHEALRTPERLKRN